MSVLDFIFNSKKKKGKEHLRNLMNMAMADGVLDDTEYEFLKNIALKYDIPVSEVDKLKIEISKQTGYTFEKSLNKFEQIYDLIKMMMADNHIDKREMQMCKVFAKKIGFAPQHVDELVDSVIQNITIGNSAEETRKRLMYLIKD